jgi:tetratricopeptide (TPR) repeat protein
MSTRKGKSKPTPPAGKPQLQDLLDVRTCLDLLEEKKLDQARTLCDTILKRAPNLVFANNARGLIAQNEGQYPLAEQYLRRAVSLDPYNAEYVTSLANAVLKQDRIDESIKLYEQAIGIDKEFRDARIGLANALHEKNDPEASIAYFEDAVLREPDAPGPLSHLGRALTDAKRYDEAVTTILRALALDISFAPAHTALGEAFYAMGMYKESLESHKTALLMDPKEVYAHSKIADAYLKLEQPDLAHEHFQQIIDIAPNDPNNYARLAVSIAATQHRIDEAMTLFRKALALDPRHALTYNNLGVVMHDNGQTLEALSQFEKALEIQPTYSTAVHNMSLGQLLHGRLKEGWKNHESRLIVRERTHVYRLIHKLFNIIPKWDGVSSLAGKQILLLHEQGLGDSIQFVRYVSLLQQRGARVVLHVKNPLYRLFQSYSPDVTLVRETDPLPPCDCAYVLMSLPYALGTDTVEDIPSVPAYLSAAPAEKERVRLRLAEAAPDTRRLRVGIVWGGNPEHGNDRRRSIALSSLQPLFDLDGIDFFSLQKGKPTEDLQQLPPSVTVFNLGEQFNDFADTAATIANLDLVISVDTSVLHLAGALGGRSWALLANTPDWRWLLERDDSPWYPNMRLFRQTEDDNWEPVVARMAIELAALRDSKAA